MQYGEVSAIGAVLLLYIAVAAAQSRANFGGFRSFVKESGDHFLAILSRLVMATPDNIRSALQLLAVMLRT